jgi:MoaA/NifB/PqqE/SkfB family radical SAM enzyme
MTGCSITDPISVVKKVYILMPNSEFMGKIRNKRYSDSIKGIVSLASSNILGRPVVWGMPPAAGIELTNCCNLACPECASGSGIMKRKKGYMSSSLFGKIIDEEDSGLLSANLYFQGEPMMHPGFFSFIEKAAKLRLTVSTNGHFLTGENADRIVASSLDKLIVSIDGMDSETYLLYRKNGDYENVVEGIRRVSEARRRMRSSLKLEIQFLVNRYNEAQIPAARKLAAATGAKLRLKSMQVVNGEMKGYWMPEDERFRRYELNRGGYTIKSSLRNRCSRLWLNPVITWDGLVLPCCFDKDAEHVMGDINISSLREIWYGERYKDFRRSLLLNRKGIGICTNCTSGLKRVKF